mmetsp:Transcript_31359/g.65534  ORF Transcript_31359/g.65534 Transcript_31359/m.65534 type:complete len:94 (-) Transcript_31359:20-301(-)
MNRSTRHRKYAGLMRLAVSICVCLGFGRWGCEYLCCVMISFHLFFILKQSSFDVHFAVEKSDIWKQLTGDLDDSMTITKFISHEILAFVLCFK